MQNENKEQISPSQGAIPPPLKTARTMKVTRIKTVSSKVPHTAEGSKVEGEEAAVSEAPPVEQPKVQEKSVADVVKAEEVKGALGCLWGNIIFIVSIILNIFAFIALMLKTLDPSTASGLQNIITGMGNSIGSLQIGPEEYIRSTADTDGTVKNANVIYEKAGNLAKDTAEFITQDQ